MSEFDELNDAYGQEMKAANAEANTLIKCLKDALGTDETGDALIEVARNAHRAEQELAALKRKQEEKEAFDTLPDDYEAPHC